MQKRGQITFFLLGSIVLVLIVFLTTSFQEQQARVEQAKQIQDNPRISIQSYVQTCLDQTAKRAVYDVSLQGGYHRAPIAHTPVLNAKVPDYWVMGADLTPDVNRVESELGLYIEEEMVDCLDDFKIFKEQGFSFSDGEIVGSATAGKETTILSMKYPVTVSKGQTSFALNDFSSSVSVPIASMHAYALEIIEEQKKDPDMVPVGFITGLAVERGLTFEIIYINEKTVVTGLMKEIDNSDPLIYAFASKYAWGEDEN